MLTPNKHWHTENKDKDFWEHISKCNKFALPRKASAKNIEYYIVTEKTGC